jgi:hypothetical protein
MKAAKFAIPLLIAVAYGPAQGLATPILDTAGAFAVLGGSATTNTGATTIIGDYGVSPGSSLAMTGVTLTGTSHPTDAVAQQAQSDLTTAYAALKGLSGLSLTGQDLGGLNLGPGVYSFATSADLTGTLTLNAGGAANALFVFDIGTTLTTASGPGSAAVQIINPGANDAVYWVIGSAATLGTYTSFEGNILALSQIALQTGATIGCGRALNQTPGPVTMDTNTISIGCSGVTGEGRSNGLSGGASLEFSGGEIVIAGTETILSVPGTILSSAVPEPGTLVLFGFGLMGLFASRKNLFPVA